MRKIVFLYLAAMFMLIPSAGAQDGYPVCWETELTTSLVSVPFYESYFSWLEDVDSAEDLVEFANSHIPSRDRDWGSNERCAEAIELTWWAQRELSLRAAYKAIHFGLRAKINADPAVLAEYNPLRGVLSAPYHPDSFRRMVDDMQALIDSSERRYTLSPEDGALPACTGAELVMLAPVLPPYRQVIDAAQHVDSIDALLDLADLHIAWRKTWANEVVHRSADGKISASPRDGLATLPACAEAAQLLWLMNVMASDTVRSAALKYAGLHDHNNPYLSALQGNAGMINELIARVESAEPSGVIRKWTTCAKAQRAALNDKLPEYQAVVLERTSPQTLEDFLAYMRSEITWRRHLWSSLPDCADAVELALTITQFAGDLRAFFAFWLAEAPIEAIPYLDEAEDGEFSLDTFGAGLVGGSLYREFPARLRTCSENELEQVSTVVAQYHIYREYMTSFRSMAGFFDVAESILKWRDSLHPALPTCKEAYETGVLMSQIADDHIALFGLTFAGYGRETNPYYTWFQRNSRELADLLKSIPVDPSTRDVLWEYGGELNTCDGEQVAALSRILSDYLALLERGQRVHSLDELEAFGDQNVKWRREIWPQLPACAEAFEIGLLVYRGAGDQILFDVPAIAASQLVNIIGSDAALKTRLGEIYAELPRNLRDQHSGEIESYRRHCSAGQTATIIEALQGFAALLDSASLLAESPADFNDYVDDRLAWRSEFASILPRCMIAFKLESALALDLAQAFSASIPVVGAILSGSDLLQVLAASLAGGENRVQAIKPNTNRMPHCSEAELRSVHENREAYTDLIDDVSTVETEAELFKYLQRKLNWRDEFWSQLPICAESLQFGFLIHQIASDIASAAALNLHEIAEDENPFPAEQMEGRAALHEIEEQISGLIESGARKDTLRSSDRQLRRCSEAEMDVLSGFTYDHHLFPSFDHRSMPILLEYVEQLLSWRAETWAPLPPCIEAYTLGSLASQQAGDIVTFFALEWAGVKRAQSSFMRAAAANAVDAAEYVIMLRTFDRAGIDQFIAERYSSAS